ncbi:hypothetical protein BB934_45095 (plasmid) [Microvirga ossetica]|uniref:Uncharacterized protein n=1 Tax=Microvirga ossetica TaxID=1882682 RepID=A0A1B2EZQ8_9HYPH|nr:hypothetical protein [Microvirga ossetica]ANY85398.1 hypothetical protein BB934_45095 [Microvirga ossetica]
MAGRAGRFWLWLDTVLTGDTRRKEQERIEEMIGTLEERAADPSKHDLFVERGDRMSELVLRKRHPDGANSILARGSANDLKDAVYQRTVLTMDQDRQAQRDARKCAEHGTYWDRKLERHRTEEAALTKAAAASSLTLPPAFRPGSVP